MKGNSSMCDPQQKATEGRFSFIFWNELYIFNFPNYIFQFG